MTETQQVVAALWLRYRARMFERLVAVEAAVRAARDGTLDSGLREAGRREAHKLAGSLGTFGLHEGTEPARVLEHALEDGVLTNVPELESAAAALRSVLERAPAA